MLDVFDDVAQDRQVELRIIVWCFVAIELDNFAQHVNFPFAYYFYSAFADLKRTE